MICCIISLFEENGDLEPKFPTIILYDIILYMFIIILDVIFFPVVIFL